MTEVKDAPPPGLREIFLTTPDITSSQWQQLSLVTRWLLMVRAPVIIMTITSTVTGILLAAADGFSAWDIALALLIGLSLAHACNNLVNDWTDHSTGLDAGNYFRTQYGVHVLEQRLVSQKAFAGTFVVTMVCAFAAAFYVYLQAGEEILYLTAAGSFFVFFYTWPLKHIALGELTVLLVWGPLMTAGSYFAIAGTVNADIILLSLFSGIGPTLVIFGKHIDKLEQDRQKGVRSLPVVLGDLKARQVTRGLIAAQWLLFPIIIWLTENLYLLLCLLAILRLGKLWRVLGEERPQTRPGDYPATIWPLWYSAASFGYTRDLGLWLMAALVLDLLV
ncbi:MAG: prenyltransferase [Pseudomonadales bacterium]|nr:prenyltransferase [Pseudomonadales bacterium]